MCFDFTEEEIHFLYIKLKLCGGEAQRPIRTSNKLLSKYSQGEGLDSCL